MPSKCPKGKIRRKAYVTKRGTKVKSTCTVNKGLPGKTPKNRKVLPKLKKGELTEYGYHLKNSAEKREKSLRKAMKNEGNLEVLRRVVVLRTYMKNEPAKFKKLNKDVEYIQKIRAQNKLKGGGKRKTKTAKRKTTKRKTTGRKKTKTVKRKSALKRKRTFKTKRKVKKVRFRL